MQISRKNDRFDAEKSRIIYTKTLITDLRFLTSDFRSLISDLWPPIFNFESEAGYSGFIGSKFVIDRKDDPTVETEQLQQRFFAARFHRRKQGHCLREFDPEIVLQNGSAL